MKKVFGLVLIVLIAVCVQPATASLVSHWELNGDLTDSVGSNDGSCPALDPEESIEYVTDGGRQAVQFSPTTYSDATQRIVVPYTSELNTESFTISVWAKAAYKGTYGGVVSTADKNPTSTDEAGYIIYTQPITTSEGKDDYWTFWTGNGNWQKAYSGELVDGGTEEGEWTMVTVTYDAMSADQCIYVNGVLAGSINTGTPYVPAADSDFFIGAAGNYGTPTYSYNGMIDDVRYYDNAMSASEISALYEATVPEPATLILLGIGGVVLRRRK